jgi:uncharacterized protein
MENYGIEVVEVSDMNDVLEYYTGHIFPVTPSNNSISTEDYIYSMKPLASNLLTQANTSFNNASELFDSTEIPNYFPNYYRNQVSDFLNTAEDALVESYDWYDQDLFYTSTSKSFQSLINSKFVTYACEYFSTEEKDDYIQTRITELTNYHENESIKSKNAEIEGSITLQCVGAAQKRASEATDYIFSANNNFISGDHISALYQIAFAMQRTESSSWWLGLSEFFNDTSLNNIDDIKALADDYIMDAEQAIVYSNVILSEIGESSSFLNDANDMLESAKEDNENGYSAAALYEALEALSKANLALELVDADSIEKILSKIQRANESASASISESRLLGIEPILAVSYYEYAESLIESNANTALFYYKYSDLITGVITVASGYSSNHSSRYIGIPDISTSFILFSRNNYQYYALIFGFLGIIIGVSIGLLFGMLYYKKEPKKVNQNEIINKPYYVKTEKKNNELIKDEKIDDFPENINDFFKK